MINIEYEFDFVYISKLYEMQFTINLIWHEGRLTRDVTAEDSIVPPEIQSCFWRPDLLFLNLRSGRRRSSNFAAATNMAIFDGKMMFLENNFLLRIDCRMSLYKYPFDTQMCKLLIGSRKSQINFAMIIALIAV